MIAIPNRLRLFCCYAFWTLAAWLAVTTSGWGAVPQLLRNINTAIVPQSSSPGFLGILNGKMLFAAADGTGPALWSTDGSSMGTVPLRHVPIAAQIVYPGPSNFVVMGNIGYFVVLGPTQGAQIWSTDGTSTGTALAVDLHTPAGGGAIPILYGVFGSRLVFSADDIQGNLQLFATNVGGTGVQVLTNNLAGTGVVGLPAVAGNKMYFATYGPAGGGGIYNGTIWASDGTSAGTHAVTNSTMGDDAIHYPQYLTVEGTQVLYTSNGRLWSIDTSTDTISAVSTANGSGQADVSNAQLIDMGGYVAFLGGGSGAIGSAQVWRSDGTTAGTYGVAPAAAQTYPLFQRLGNRILFYGTDAQNNLQVMSSDLTVGNVVQLTTGTQPSNVSFTRAIYHGTVAGLAYFSVSDGPQTTTWSVLRTDGTAAGTRRVGGLPAIDQSEPGLTRVAGDSTAVYIQTYGSDTKAALYEYDSAADSSRLLLSGFYSSLIDGFQFGAGSLYFGVNDPVTGDEPWVSHGTAAGTHLVANLNPEISDSGSRPENFVALNGKLVFSADDGVHGRELWTSDGTTNGTVLLSDVNPGAAGSNPNHLFVSDNVLYFFAADANGKQNFMRLAGSSPAQTLVSNLSPPQADQYGFVQCHQDAPVVLNGVVYFAANDGNSGMELWSTDGTATGTHRVADIAPGPIGSNPCGLTVFNNHLYFSAAGPGGNELWTSDGTSTGTLQVLDIAQGAADSGPSGLTVFNGALYFGAFDSTKWQLWQSNGFASGTAPLGGIAPNAGGYAVPVGVVNNKLLVEVFTFDPQAGNYTSELWATDGTPAGALDLGVSPAGDVFVSKSGLAYFQTGDVEPWVSDGTLAGTHLLRAINPVAQSAIQWFADFHGLTLFTVTDPVVGAQLWRSDGSLGGTTRVASIAPQPTPLLATVANHLQLAVGNQFFMAGQDPVVGSELYGLILGLPVGAADSAHSDSDQPVTINVVSNDSDADGTLNPASVSVTTAAGHGTVAAGANGSLVYTPTAGYAGTDTFAYTVSDDQGATSSPATVTVTVTAPAATPPNTGSSGGGGAMGILELLGLFSLGALRIRRSLRLIAITGALMVAGCGGGGGGEGATGTTSLPPPSPPAQYKVGGTVSGLADGAAVVLENQSKENLKITANGAFTFATTAPTGTAYSVHVATQPSAPDQQCSVANGDGTTGSSDVSNIAVACVSVIGADSARDVARVGNRSVESLLQLASFVGERLTYLSAHLANTVTEACSDGFVNGLKNGSATYTFTDTDASGSLTPGDTVTIVANQCLSPSLADYASGTLTVTLVPPPAAVATGVAWFATADVTSLQLSNQTFDGRLDVDYIAQETMQTVRARTGASAAMQITYAFPSDVVNFTSADTSKIIDYTLPQYSVKLAAVFQSKSVLGPYAISTPDPLQGRLGIYPVSGTERFTAGPSVLEYGARDSSDNLYVQVSLDATGSGSPIDIGTGTSSFEWNDGLNGFCWYEPRGLNNIGYRSTPGYTTSQRDQWQMRLMFTEPAESDPINQVLSTGMDANAPIKLFFSGPVDPSTLSVDFAPLYYGSSQSNIAAVTTVAGPVVALTAQSQLQHGQTYTLETLNPVQSIWPSAPGTNVTLNLITFNNLQADAGPSPGVAAPGQTVTLLSSRSFSTNSTIVHYAWTQTGGPAVTLNGASAANATFAVPAGSHSGDALHFNLTITDANGSTDSAPVTVFVLTDLTQPFLYYRQQQASAVGQIDELAVMESPASGTIRTELGGVADPAADLFRFIYSATNNVRPLNDELQFMTPGRAIVANAYTNANTTGGMPFFLSSLPFQCNDPAWTFTVYESVSAADGTAAKFSADFTQTCPGNLPPYTGSIRVNSTVPLP